MATLIQTKSIFMMITVNQLLFRERKELSRFNKLGAFEGSNAGEGPACAASVLIFDRGDCTILNPINVFGKVRLRLVPGPDPINGIGKFVIVYVEVQDFTVVILIFRRWDETLDCLVLGLCPVSELVVSELKVLGFVAAIVLTDEPVVVRESLEAHRKLLDFLIDLIKTGSVLDELELIRFHSGRGSNEGSDSNRLHL